MDLLQLCALSFEQILPYQYHIIAGRKGKIIDFIITFDQADFHHLAGLHKLKDNIRFLTGKRSNILKEILSGKLTLSHAQQSNFYNEIQIRLTPLLELESFLDSNEIIFRYNRKLHKFSLMQADYLLQNNYQDQDIYLFLTARSETNIQVCRSFFPKKELDYSKGQPRYTLLKKEKINTKTGNIEIQFDKLTQKK